MIYIKSVAVRRFLLVILLGTVYCSLWAQNPLFPGIHNLDRKIIVKDSTGRIVSQREWMTLTTTFKYKFNRVDSTGEQLVYILKKMDEAEKKGNF